MWSRERWAEVIFANDCTLDPENNDAYKFSGCKQGDKIDVKKETEKTISGKKFKQETCELLIQE